MHRSMWLLAAVVAVAGACLAVPALAGAATFSNSGTITITSPFGVNNQPASPYPSVITVSGVAGTIADVNVTLTGLSHGFPDDVDVLLVGPNGQTTLLMADTGGIGPGVSGVNLTFDDAAAGSLPDDSAFASGTYKPTKGTTVNGEGGPAPSSFPSPAPAGSYGSTLSVFNGTNPNGAWSLYVLDDTEIDAGSISGGWSLDITTEPLAVTVAAFTAKRNHGSVVVRWRTGTEEGTLGFNVYRQQGSRRVRVNRRLIPAIGGISGRAYSVLDRRAPRHRAVRYWLQDVSTSGARTWHGPVRVAAA